MSVFYSSVFTLDLSYVKSGEATFQVLFVTLEKVKYSADLLPVVENSLPYSISDEDISIKWSIIDFLWKPKHRWIILTDFCVIHGWDADTRQFPQSPSTRLICAYLFLLFFSFLGCRDSDLRKVWQKEYAKVKSEIRILDRRQSAIAKQ